MGQNKSQFQARISKTSKKTGLPIGKIYDFLYYLKAGPVENNTLLVNLGIARNALNSLKSELTGWLDPASHYTSLNPTGIAVANDVLSPNHLTSESMWNFLRDTPAYTDALDLLRKYSHLRVKPKRQYDQFTATVETTALRSALLDFQGDIRGQRLLFLGDDDFTSVCIAKTGYPASVSVLDIDKDVLNNLNQVAVGENLTLKTVKYDARSDLPANYKDQHDIVFTDPPYTPAGIELFLSRAIQALDKSNPTARIYICYGNSDLAKERFIPIYEAITRAGLMIRYVFDKFNRYHGAESIGSTSSLFICEVTPKTKPVINGKYGSNIYTA